MGQTVCVTMKDFVYDHIDPEDSCLGTSASHFGLE